MKRITAIVFAALLTFNAQAQNNQPSVIAKPKQGNQLQTNSKGKHTGVSPQQRIQHKVELMQSQLGLNVEQAKKLTQAMTIRNQALKVIKEKTGENKDAFRTEAMPIRKKFQTDLKTILNADQFAKLKEMRKANKRIDNTLPATKENQGDDLIDETEPYLEKKN
jgi:F0F1-type ATP synthase membrane subunit b/b'